jgi:methylated-DNA-[protein]-cysteine S-methyltransferase
MSATGFALFETAIGVCGIAWSGQGVVAVQLPDGDAAGTRARLLRRHPGAVEGSPPDEVQQAIADMQAHLAGQRRDLGTVRLDPEGIPPFNHRVYEVARTIPPGATTTYGALATRLGEPGAARAVGQALGHNPYPLIVPCHRVLAAGGHLGGFSAAGGRVTKLRLLELEGFRTDDHPSLFDEPTVGDG